LLQAQQSALLAIPLVILILGLQGNYAATIISVIVALPSGIPSSNSNGGSPFVISSLL
jgi:hypothetical protein